MFNLKVNDQVLTVNFVFLECLFRMLFVWHEPIDFHNAKKNLRMVNHLIVKYDLNPLFKSNRLFIQVMNLLGNKYEDNKLSKRLKTETLNSRNTQKIEPGQTKEDNIDKGTVPENRLQTQGLGDNI